MDKRTEGTGKRDEKEIESTLQRDYVKQVMILMVTRPFTLPRFRQTQPHGRNILYLPGTGLFNSTQPFCV